MARSQSSIGLMLWLLSTIINFVTADLSMENMPLYSSADTCAQQCIMQNDDLTWGDGDLGGAAVACDVDSSMSALVDSVLWSCAYESCLRTDTAVVSSIFSQYCDVQGFGANHVLAVVSSTDQPFFPSSLSFPTNHASTATASPAATSHIIAASTGAVPFHPQYTSASSSSSGSKPPLHASSKASISPGAKAAIVFACLSAAAAPLAGYFGYQRRRKAQAYNDTTRSSDDDLDRYQSPSMYAQEHEKPEIVLNKVFDNVNNNNNNSTVGENFIDGYLSSLNRYGNVHGGNKPHHVGHGRPEVREALVNYAGRWISGQQQQQQQQS